MTSDKTNLQTRVLATMKRAAQGDPTLWRHPLAEATMDLLARGVPVTVESLISRLEVTGEGVAVELRRASSQGAIERLREIVVKQD